jgi:hypothetical protein
MLCRAEERYVNTEVLRFVHGRYSPLSDKPSNFLFRLVRSFSRNHGRPQHQHSASRRSTCPAIAATAPAIGRKTEEVALMISGWASTPPRNSVECEP